MENQLKQGSIFIIRCGNNVSKQECLEVTETTYLLKNIDEYYTYRQLKRDWHMDNLVIEWFESNQDLIIAALTKEFE
jgi:hypothetical protein